MNRNMRIIVLLAIACIAAKNLGAAELPPLQKDIEYAKVGEVSLRLDAFVPAGEGPFPTCILVHGGAFTKGTKQSYITPLFEPLSKAGFVWFTIDYRLAPDHRWPACADDVQTAIRWVKEHAQEYKVDPKRIALIGESAGGLLVSYVGAVGKDETSVAAVVPFYAPHDLEFQVDSRGKLGDSMTALLGLTELNDDARKALRAASASTAVHEKMPPYLLIHGDKDEQVPYEQSPRFLELLKKHGNLCELLTISGGGHGMSGWKALDSNYQEQMIAWLKNVLR